MSATLCKGLNTRLRRLKGKTRPSFPREEPILPYKDPEERHRYDHAYKPRLRGQKGVTNSGQTPVRKAYICFRFPELKLSHIPFRNGWFVTDSPDEQARIEQDPMYGSAIFSWRLELRYPDQGIDKETVHAV